MGLFEILESSWEHQIAEQNRVVFPTHEKVRCQEQGQLNGAPGQRFASTAGGVKVERPERAIAREDERP